MRRLTKLALIAVAAACAGAVVAAIWPDDAGICYSERRFLSDTEKIEAAADYIRNGFHIVLLVPRGDGSTAEVSARTPVYASAAEFMAANPGCCRMAGPGSPAELRHPEWIEREGRRPERSVVVIDMAVPFTGPDGERRTATFRTNIAIKPCGHVVPRQLFERVARFERKTISDDLAHLHRTTWFTTGQPSCDTATRDRRGRAMKANKTPGHPLQRTA